MPPPNQPRPWISIAALFIAITAVIYSVFFAGHPPPGDIIVLHPDPIDPFTATSPYWTIGGGDPTCQYEPADAPFLNENAFTYLYEYYMRAQKDGVGPMVKVSPPEELRASFGHCSDYSAMKCVNPCEKDTDCASGTCVISALRVTYETGGKQQKIHWYLTPSPKDKEFELQPHKYGDSTYWRGELCGRLIGRIEGTQSTATYIVPPTYGTVSIQVEP